MLRGTERETADLHCHTTCSDGAVTPGGLVEAAVAAGLRTVAVTDHDTLAGIEPARAAAAAIEAARRPEVVAGIEVSCRVGGRELHLLGLWVDPACSELQELAAANRAARETRLAQLLERARRLRLRLSDAEVRRHAGSAPVGRPHVAAALVQAGAARDLREAFRRYLGIGRPLYVPRPLPEAPAAIAAVHRAGGVAVVAHPGSSRVREALLNDLARQGLDGLEVRHPKHGRERERILLRLCRRLGLLPSGGSDFHGPGRGDAALGQIRVPQRWVEALYRRAESRRSA